MNIPITKFARDFFEVWPETPFSYDDLTNSLNWNAILIEAMKIHQENHTKELYRQVCGDCIKTVLLRKDE